MTAVSLFAHITTFEEESLLSLWFRLPSSAAHLLMGVRLSLEDFGRTSNCLSRSSSIKIQGCFKIYYFPLDPGTLLLFNTVGQTYIVLRAAQSWHRGKGVTKRK